MNSGIIFGWKDEKQRQQYYNLLLSGTDILLERNGFAESDNRRSRHLTEPVPFSVLPREQIELTVDITESTISVSTQGVPLFEHERSLGVVGRVGLRPWRSQMECVKFEVSSLE